MSFLQTRITLIFLWGLVLLSVVVMCTLMPDILDIDDGPPFYVLLIILGGWGILSGLVFKDEESLFRKYVSIRNPIATLFMTIAFASIFGAFYFMHIDPLEEFGYAQGLFRYMAMFFFFAGTLLGGAFLVGFVPAVLVRLLRLALAWALKSFS